LFKTLLIRMFFIYMISSLFRRGNQPQQQAGSTAPANTGAFNVFLKDTTMVGFSSFCIFMKFVFALWEPIPKHTQLKYSNRLDGYEVYGRNHPAMEDKGTIYHALILLLIYTLI